MASTQILENIWQPQPPGFSQPRARLIREMAGSKKSSSSNVSGSMRIENIHEHVPARTRDGWETDSLLVPTTRPEPDFQINTSALKRAFPDFSQATSSDGDDSIEVGRGFKEDRSNQGPPSEDVSEALPFTFGGGQNYRLIGTPPIKPYRNRSRAGPAHDTEDKENEAPVKETKTGSGSSGKGSIDSHRTLIGKQATVESDDGGILKEVPPSVMNRTHSTRFSTSRGQSNTATAVTRQSEIAAHNGTHTSMLSGANQSFALPDVANITELISGERSDGASLFNRSAKSRSKFHTPARLHPGIRPSHVLVENVPIPANVKALYISLQLLQEKVAALEAEKEQNERKELEQEHELLQLKSRLETYEHRDIKIGPGVEIRDRSMRDTEKQKSKLESSLQTLQQRLEKANKKLARSESRVTELTKDRDALQHQLGSNFFDAGGQNEAGALGAEVQRLRKQLVQISRDHDHQINSLSKRELELRAKIERREQAINQMAALAKELWNTRNALSALRFQDATLRVPTTEAPQLSAFNQEVNEHRSRDALRGSKSARSRSSTKWRDATHQATEAPIPQPNATYDREDNGDGLCAEESTTHIEARQSDLAKNSTFLSFMEGDEVSKLRRVVDEDKARLAEAQGQQSNDDAPSAPKNNQQKSSLKKVAYGNFTQYSITGDDHTGTNVTAMEQSNVRQTTGSRRRTVAPSDVTSAFILPDITLRSGPLDEKPGAPASQKVTIPRPTPVSDRLPNADELDATVRPAQDPAVALATVLKGLEDEMKQLRAQLAEQESLYHKHDPALSKRRRKIVFGRMQRLLSTIETRADQIYALYDVLEGQKAKGQLMKAEEIEVTLQNLGIDVDQFRGSASYERLQEASEDDSSEDESAELPTWAGFEPTETQTLEHLQRTHRQ